MLETDTDNPLRYTSASTNVTIANLLPFAVYSVSVSAETVIGAGPLSSQTMIQMPEDGRTQ